jgi:DNA processing protein
MSDARRGSAALLAALPGMGPRRLTLLLDRWEPEQAWAVATAGNPRPLDVLRVPDPDGPTDSIAALARAWARAAATRAAPAAEGARHEAAGVAVLLRADPEYPPSLLEDPAPPPVLFARGQMPVLDGPRVAIVGTRRCTGAGAAIARELGRDLSSAGVVVVSGLALGIDGAAHRGVRDVELTEPQWAGPVGVVGCGHDQPYPARHRDLWSWMGERGLLLGEAPLGIRPAPWRFPARNRIIAALADVVVVVESHAAGGSLLTVREAVARGIDVMAVPGSVRSPAAAGTNQLLADGCHPVRDADDVLVALGMLPGGRRGRSTDRRPPPDAGGKALLEAFDWEPATLEHLALRTGRTVPDLALALHHLTADGWVVTAGAWYERVGRP